MTPTGEYFSGGMKPSKLHVTQGAMIVKITKLVRSSQTNARTLLLRHQSQHQHTREDADMLGKCSCGSVRHKDKCGMLWTVNKSFHNPFREQNVKCSSHSVGNEAVA